MFVQELELVFRFEVLNKRPVVFFLKVFNDVEGNNSFNAIRIEWTVVEIIINIDFIVIETFERPVAGIWKSETRVGRT